MFVGMGANGASGGYNLENSLRFRSSASAYLSRTPTVTGNRKTWTFSCWTKRGLLTGSQVIFSAANSANSQFVDVTINGNNVFELDILDSNSTRTIRTSTAVLRDPSAWYHIVLVIDTTQATAADRIKLYVNNELLTTSAGTGTFPNQNADTQVNATTGIHAIARRQGSADRYYDAYLTEIQHIDGTALTPSDFGDYNEDTGVWQPIEYEGTYGTNGFYLPFKPTTQATGFNTVLYTGNGTSQSITGVGFEPDLVWLKFRSATGNNELYDTIRGAGNLLVSNSTNAESTNLAKLSSLDSDGFSVGSALSTNTNGGTYVAWCWDAGTGSPVSNTDGTITSTVKANPATGFSVVSYTGNGLANQSVGHGLTQSPEIKIIKDRVAGTYNWTVTGSLLGTDQKLFLNTTGAVTTSVGFYPLDTASVLSISGVNSTAVHNASGDTYIAYAFHSVEGYSKIGSYTGNGTSNSITGLGFKPAWIMIKDASNGTRSWSIVDNTRSVNDDREDVLYPNLSAAEGVVTNYDISFDADGFTVGSNAQINASGSNIIYMAFADTRDAQFNFDASGNKNNWTANNINSNASGDTTYDIMTDVPTLTDEDTANYVTLNPLMPTSVSNTTFSDGNLKIVPGGNQASYYGLGTIGLKSGKWYFEAQGNRVGTSTSFRIGFSKNQGVVDANIAIYNAAGNYTIEGTTITGKATYTNGDIIGTAVDLDSNTIEFFKNNTSQGSVSISSGEWYPHARIYATNSYTTENIICNFGQQPFKYTPPTGYKKLNTFNLPDSSIVDGSEYFNTVLYTGNGTGQSITGVGFQPDLVWIKSRSDVDNNILQDAVRGVTRQLFSANTNAETNYTNGVTSFNADGFTVATSNWSNENGQTRVAWNWKAGDTAVSNTDGTITSQVSANPTAGFSIVTWTSPGNSVHTIGHGLGVTPSMVITKTRSSVAGWASYHASIGNTQGIYLDLTNTPIASANFWNNTSPTPSVMTIGAGIAGAGITMVAYCFAEVEGYSKFGSYTGNGSADGPFVYTGFRPAFLIIKQTNASGQNWLLQDSSRPNYNPTSGRLFANLTNAEATDTGLPDFLSNGFKMRQTSLGNNGSGATYIYMAFAENPFKNSLAR